MRKGSDVIGISVVTYDTGQKIERIRDLIFDQKQNQLLGFLVEEKGLFRDAKVIPLEEVQAIGLDAIVVHSQESVIGADRIPAIKEILHHNNVLMGTRILTTTGIDLGGLVDLFFDEHSGLVEGYEVSGGVFADAYSGRSFVPAPETLKIGDDVAFVPPETVQMMQEQVGGIRGAVQAAGDRLQDSAETANRRLQATAQTANEQLQSSVENVNRRLQEASQNAGEQLQAARESTSARIDSSTTHLRHSVDELAAHTVIEQAIGRRILQTVRAKDGSIIAASGQIVTESILDRAETYGKEAELLNAVGLTLATAFHSTASDTWLETKVQLRDRFKGAAPSEHRASVAQENLKTFWQILQQKAEELQGRRAQASKKQRIEQALGRPVTRVILDPEDKVILNVGELITHRAVSQATESGVLNILLSSVYLKEPEISDKELRASGHGMAALEYHGNGRSQLEVRSVHSVES